MAVHNSCPPGVTTGREFRTTCWDHVRLASHPDRSLAEPAQSALCRDYWYPLYAYLRSSGHPPAEAQDLVQGFFAKLLSKDGFADADSGKGRFRSFLLGALKHHISDERKRTLAQKRGGGLVPIPIDESCIESRFQMESRENRTPEERFDRDWGLGLLTRVLESLRESYGLRGRMDLFDALRPCLGGTLELPPYADLAKQLGMSPDNVKVAIHRLRHEFGRSLRKAVRESVGDEDEVDAELHYLLRIISE